MPYYNRYHSICAEDQKVRHLGILPVSNGVFVDVGAGPPFDGNNTGHFERNGWTGLCVDAHPRVIENLTRERTCKIEHCAVGTDESGYVPFFINGDMNLSSKLPGRPCIGEIQVPGARLETLLTKHGIGKIDLLSIDAEGCDLDVWKSMDWVKHRPTVVIIEPGDERWAIQLEMRSKGYDLVEVTADNLIFKLNLEWQCSGDDEWRFGPKIRGFIRPTLGEIYFDEDKDDPRGGWIWFTLCLEKNVRGITANRGWAIMEVEKALGEYK